MLQEERQRAKMDSTSADYEVDDRGHGHHGDALTGLKGRDAHVSERAFFAGFVPPSSLIADLHGRVRSGGVLVGANRHTSRNQGTPECCQHWQPLSGAGPA